MESEQGRWWGIGEQGWYKVCWDGKQGWLRYGLGQGIWYLLGVGVDKVDGDVWGGKGQQCRWGLLKILNQKCLSSIPI